MNNKPTIIVIFGVSGDLARRYLLPAVGAISSVGMMPEDFHIVGVTRQEGIEKDFLIKKSSNQEYLKEHMSLQKLDLDNLDDYIKLDKYLESLENNFDKKSQCIFYISVPPQVSKSIVEFIGTSGLSKRGEVKLLLEKPFGTNLENAVELSHHINHYFLPDEVYRVDHYMAKETAQNIIVFRDGNSLFKKTWNKDFIESIEVVASEEIGIEGRANFYEQTGALRDIVQGHLIQLLSMVLMKLPDDNRFDSVPSLRLEALKHLSIKDIENDAMRGQYEGYKEDVENTESNVETFVSIKLESDHPDWVGVPIILKTGKAMQSKFTEIRIKYKKEKNHESNELLLQLQPKEEIQFNMWAKRPGYERKISPHTLSFKYKEYYEALPGAYEQVIFSAINGDHSLFTSSEEVLEAWRILDKIQKKWQENGRDLFIYKKGINIDEVQ